MGRTVREDIAWGEWNRLPVQGGVRVVLCLSPLFSVTAHAALRVVEEGQCRNRTRNDVPSWPKWRSAAPDFSASSSSLHPTQPIMSIPTPTATPTTPSTSMKGKGNKTPFTVHNSIFHDQKLRALHAEADALRLQLAYVSPSSFLP